MLGFDTKLIEKAFGELVDTLKRIEKNQLEILRRLPDPTAKPGGK